MQLVAPVEHAIADRVGERGVADVLVPCLGRELSCNDDGARIVAVVEHFEQILALLIGERCDAEVVDHQHVEASKPGKYAGMGSVCPSEAQFL